MIFHTIRTITVGEFSEMQTLDDRLMIKRINVWLPYGLVNKAYERLVTAYNKNTNSKQVNELFDESSHKLSILIKVNIQFSSLLKLIDMAAKVRLLGYEDKFKEVEIHLKEAYKLIYKREPSTQKDYERVARDSELAIKRYKQMYPDKPEDDKQEVDFEQIIVNTEAILAPMTIRDKKLYTLNRYFEMAAKKIKSNG